METQGTHHTGEDRQMEITRNHVNEQVTTIDAATLDDDQFNQLINGIDARNPLVLYLILVFMVIAGVSIAL